MPGAFRLPPLSTSPRSNMKCIILCALTLLISVAAVQATEPLAVFASGARILFQGDSITDGNRGRSADPNHILGHGYAFIIAAKYGAAFAALNLDFMNRGVSGNTALNLQKRGINDHSHGVPLD